MIATSRGFESATEDKCTARFYMANATQYASETRTLDMSSMYGHFLKYLPQGSLIMDAGSGSGRDTRAFLGRGFLVDAFDSSEAMARLSTELTGVQTRVLRFEEFDEHERYDGIWACASLLHVPRMRLDNAIARLIGGLKHNGILYMSFKCGNGERIDKHGRIFTDLDESGLMDLVRQLPYHVETREVWRTAGEGSRAGSDAWLNVILIRKS